MDYGQGGRGSIPGRSKIYFFSIKSRLALGIKWQGREIGHSSPGSAEVKSGETITPLSNTSSWHSTSLIKNRDNFHFYLYPNSLYTYLYCVVLN
jgi:hypothetical protein